MSDEKKSFWTTLPGIFTGIAAVITASTGLYLALNFNNKGSDDKPGNIIPDNNREQIDESRNRREENIPDNINKAGQEQNLPGNPGKTMQRILDIVARQVHMSPDKIDPDARLIEHGICNERDISEITRQMSIEFNIKIKEDELFKMPGGITVRNLSNYVNGSLP